MTVQLEWHLQRVWLTQAADHIPDCPHLLTTCWLGLTAGSRQLQHRLHPELGRKPALSWHQAQPHLLPPSGHSRSLEGSFGGS